MITRPNTGGMWAALVCLATGACATSGGDAIPAASLPACPIPAAPAGWHHVVSDDLQFCVPADWESAGSSRWQGGGGWIEWGVGSRPGSGRTRTFTVVTDRPLERHEAEDLIPIRVVHESTETIGGRAVDFRIIEEEGRFTTIADWRAPDPMYMEGGAPSRFAAEVHLDVYRTARAVVR